MLLFWLRWVLNVVVWSVVLASIYLLLPRTDLRALLTAVCVRSPVISLRIQERKSSQCSERSLCSVLGCYVSLRIVLP